MPCLNEAETLGLCINRASLLLEKNKINGEILVSDNGSTDGSQEIARGLGARVITCSDRGYGAALQFGIEHADGAFILMGDSDDSYHFDEALPMLDRLRSGYEVCMGTRLRGTIMPGAMPWLNRYFGNPVLTAIGRIFFKVSLSDFHCGMRAFRRESVLGLNLVTTGMEWASEMIIKSKLRGLKLTEVPVTLYKDGRSRPPHLNRWQDGWRHLRFMLLHSPEWLFLIPGAVFMLVGLLGEVLLMQGMLKIGHAVLDVHSLLVMSFILLSGTQMIFAGIFAKQYSYTSGILPYDVRFDKVIRYFSLERLLLVSLLVGCLGFLGLFFTTWKWYRAGFPPLDYQITMRQVIPYLTLLGLSFQGIFNGFMLSVLFLKTKASGTKAL